MAKHKFLLGAEDGQALERGHEWFTWDFDALFDLPASQLAALEAAMDGYTIARLQAELPDVSATCTRAAMFISRRRAGVAEEWQAFDPRPLRVQWEPVEGADEQDGDAAEVPTVATKGSPTT